MNGEFCICYLPDISIQELFGKYGKELPRKWYLKELPLVRYGGVQIICRKIGKNSFWFFLFLF